MLGLLNGQGIISHDDETEADVILINTCCFIGDAKEESVSAIRNGPWQRRGGNLKILWWLAVWPRDISRKFWMR